MSLVSIRDARPGDLRRLIDLLGGSSMLDIREDAAHLPKYRAAFAEIGRNHYSRVFVADVDGIAVGMIQIYAVRHLQAQGGLCAEIESFYVATEHRGRGLGTKLLQAAIVQARAWSCYRVQLTSNNARHRAHRLFTILGFEPTHVGFKFSLVDNEDQHAAT